MSRGPCGGLVGNQSSIDVLTMRLITLAKLEDEEGK